MIEATNGDLTPWRKSTYSADNNGNGVEVGTWRKASYTAQNGNCVEVDAGGPCRRLLPLERQAYRVGQFAHVRGEGAAALHDAAEDVAGHALFGKPRGCFPAQLPEHADRFVVPA